MGSVPKRTSKGDAMRLHTLLIALALLAVAGCDGAPSDGDGDSDVDADGDSDVDADADADVDADGDADTDGDGDGDSDADQGGDADGDGDGGPTSREGVWISRDEVMALPTSGPAWEALVEAADSDPGSPDLSDQDQMNNVMILAQALVHVRTGEERYRTAVRQACMDAMGTEDGGRTLALGRELAAYVIAADLVGLEPDEDTSFRAWLGEVRAEDLSGHTLVSTHEDRPNNWGTHAGASRAAVAVYLEDTAEIERTALVFRGWLGDRVAYAEFAYGDDLSWQADPDNPVGIDPVGASHEGHSLDGAQPEEMRRGCSIQFPPCETGYPWGGLEGAVVMAEILYRRGFDTFEWEDRALLRAVQFLWDLDQEFPGDGWWASGDDEWQVWLVNHVYGTDFPASLPAREGKNMGWTDWTHDRSTRPRA